MLKIMRSPWVLALVVLRAFLSLGRKVPRSIVYALGLVMVSLGLDAGTAVATTTTTLYNPNTDIGTFLSASAGSIGPDLSSSGVWAVMGALVVLFFVVGFIVRHIRKGWSVG